MVLKNGKKTFIPLGLTNLGKLPKMTQIFDIFVTLNTYNVNNTFLQKKIMKNA